MPTTRYVAVPSWFSHGEDAFDVFEIDDKGICAQKSNADRMSRGDASDYIQFLNSKSDSGHGTRYAAKQSEFTVKGEEPYFDIYRIDDECIGGKNPKSKRMPREKAETYIEYLNETKPSNAPITTIGEQPPGNRCPA